MQLLPMASSPDSLISARYAVITKTPGWEVLTTTTLWGGGGGAPPVRQLLGPATAATTPKGPQAAAAVRTRRPDAAREGQNG